MPYIPRASWRIKRECYCLLIGTKAGSCVQLVTKVFFFFLIRFKENAAYYSYRISVLWKGISQMSHRKIGKCDIPLSITYRELAPLTWENSRHLGTLPLVSPSNDVWETSAEIPYWCRVTTQIWVVLLSGFAAWEMWFNQSEALPRSRHQYGISALVSQTSFGGETSGSVAKFRLFSQATRSPITL